MTPEKYFRQHMAWSQKIANTAQHGHACLGFLVSSPVTLWLPTTAGCTASAGTERRAQAAAAAAPYRRRDAFAVAAAAGTWLGMSHLHQSAPWPAH